MPSKNKSSTAKRNNKNTSKVVLSSLNNGAKVAVLGASKQSRKSISSNIIGTSNYSSNTSTIPSAFVNTDFNSTWIKQVGKLRHSKLALDGIALMGCQPFTTFTTSATTSELVTDASLATRASNNSVFLSPDDLNGPIAAQANFHLRYCFTDVIFEFVSTVATTQAGAFCMSVTDGLPDTSGFASSFADNRQICPSITSPFRTDRCYLHYHYNGDQLWYTETDSNTLASKRLYTQALFQAWPSASSIGAIVQGYVNIWYRIELYSPVYSQGISFKFHNMEEKAILNKLREYLTTLRSKKLDDDDEKSDDKFQHVNVPEQSSSTVKESYLSSLFSNLLSSSVKPAEGTSSSQSVKR